MKRILLLFFVLYASFSFAQVSPTLAVGLETLTMNKGTIDVKVLTEIIMAKQKELKQEALRRFMYKLFPEANYTTKFYVQNCLNVLLNEKNPQVIEKEILELTTNYALSLGVTYAMVKSNDEGFKEVNLAYESYKYYSSYFQEKAIRQISIDKEYSGEIENLKTEIQTLENAIVTDLQSPKTDNNFRKELISKKEKLDEKKRKLSKLILKNDLKNQKSVLSSTNKEQLIGKISDLNSIYKNNPSVNSYFGQIKKYLEEIDACYKNAATKESELNSKFENISGLIEKIKADKESTPELMKKLNSLKNNFSDFKPSVPFGILLDVVSLSLSDIKELKDKGFFKNEIDYRNDLFYQNLNNPTASKFKEELDKLKVYIQNKITLYAKNYDVIKEFLQKNNNLSAVKIKEELLDASIDEAIAFMQSKSSNTEWLKSLTDPENAFLNQSIDKVISNQNLLTKINDMKEKASDINSILKKELTNANKKETTSKAQKLLSSLKKDVAVDTSFDLKTLIVQIENNQLNNLMLPTTPIDSINNLIKTSVDSINQLITDRKSLDDLKNIRLKTSKLLNSIPVENADYIAQLNHSLTTLDATIEPLTKLSEQLTTLRTDLNKTIKTYVEENNSEFSKIIRQSKTFSSKYLDTELNEVLNHILNPVNDKNTGFSTEALDSLTISKASAIMPEIYERVKKLINNQNIKLQDIVYLEDYVTSKLIELKIRDKNNDKIYDTILNDLKKVIPIFKLKIIENVDDIGVYNEELLTLFEFIGNLNKLDKAETYQSIIDMLRDGSQKVEDNLTDGSFKDQYILFVNAIKKYTIINPSSEKQYVEVDVVSFLNDLQQYYNRNNKSNLGLYLTLGLNQNFFFNKFQFPDSVEQINNISFASEKIGLKYRFLNFKNYNGYENIIKDDVYLNKKAPFVNEFYGILYGSGLLYSLANTANNQNFDFAHAGIGIGIRFYNALDVNAIVGFPFVKNTRFGDNAFFGLGLDIPLGEYLEKLGDKN